MTYKLTEHAIDLYSAYKQLAGITASNPTESARYHDASIHACNFIFSIYDKDRGCFYTGTTDDRKTISKDNLPLDTNI
ncbi:hypothetical protein FACS1894181_02410 [Bacteroidia bacterium]|nr:hypothetical protein FACS1894181_02410 [Bacteroidia bacterium]